MPLDIFGVILGAFAIIGIIDILAITALAFIIWWVMRSLDAQQKAAVTAFFVVGGLVLIVTLIGAEIGVVVLLAGVFSGVLSAVRPLEDQEG